MPKWVVLRTTQGKSLANEILSGTTNGPLKITRIIACRKGGMSTSKMLSATKDDILKEDRYAQDLKIIDVRNTSMAPPFDEDESLIVGQLRNDLVSEDIPASIVDGPNYNSWQQGNQEWELHQIAVFAKTDSTNEILFMLAQDKEPDIIPIKNVEQGGNIIQINYTFNILTSEDLVLKNAKLNTSGFVTVEMHAYINGRLTKVENDYLSKSEGGDVISDITSSNNSAIKGFKVESDSIKYKGVELEDTLNKASNYLSVHDKDGNVLNIDTDNVSVVQSATHNYTDLKLAQTKGSNRSLRIEKAKQADDAATLDGKHATDFMNFKVFNSENELRESEYEGYFKIKEGSQDYQCGISFRAPNNLDDAPADRKLYHNYIRVTSSADYFYETDVLIVWIDTFSENTWYHKSKKVEFEGHKHRTNDIIGFPESLPANGGNSDTVDGKHASDLQNYNNLTNKPISLKNPYNLTIQGNGTTLTNGTYDGSASKTVNITPASIGAAVGKAVSSDFNTIKTQGLYCVSSSVNAPMNYTYWSLIVLNSTSIGGNYVQQIAFKEGTVDGYIRCYKNGVWSKWKKYGDNKYSGYDCVIASFDSSDEDKLSSDFICPEDNARQLLFDIACCYGYKKIIFLNGTYNIKIDTETIKGTMASPNGMLPSVSSPIGLRFNEGQKISFEDKVILNFQTTKQFSEQVSIIELYNTGDNISVFNDSKSMVTINVTDKYKQPNITVLNSKCYTTTYKSQTEFVNNLIINGNFATCAAVRLFEANAYTWLNNIVFRDIYACDKFDNVYSTLGSYCKLTNIDGRGMNGQHIRLNGDYCNIFECDTCNIDVINSSSITKSIIKYNRNCTITNSSTYTHIISDNV